MCKAWHTLIALMTACLLTEGMLPGKAISKGETKVFGSAPK